jgi:hypothetical protein
LSGAGKSRENPVAIKQSDGKHVHSENRQAQGMRYFRQTFFDYGPMPEKMVPVSVLIPLILLWLK